MAKSGLKLKLDGDINLFVPMISIFAHVLIVTDMLLLVPHSNLVLKVYFIQHVIWYAYYNGNILSQTWILYMLI